MQQDSIRMMVERTRKHMADRRKKTRQAFQDGMITNLEMKKLKENFDEAYLDINMLRDSLRQKKTSLKGSAGKDKAILEKQIAILQQTEELVFRSYCLSIMFLKKAHKIRRQSMTQSPRPHRVLRIRLSPEELALLYGVIRSSKDLKKKATPEQQKASRLKLQQVAKMIQNGEKNQQVLLAVLQAEHTR